MRFLEIATLLSVLGVASAQLTYNITKASAPGNMEKYRCMDNKKLKSWLPKCVYECQLLANKGDGCAPEDSACHCVNFTKYSALIEPCAFPPQIGGKGHCTTAELTKARPIVNDMCNFFNATLYSSYDGCPQKLSESVTYDIIAKEGVMVFQ